MERRKISNIVVDASTFLRFSVPFLLLLTSSLVAIYFTCSQITKAIEQIEFSEGQALQVQTVLSQIAIRASYTGIASMFIISLLTLVLWIVYSHRLLGPIVPIRRHIEKLCEGDYSFSITLRKGDEFQDIANDLNRLTNVLQSKKHEK